MFVHPFTQVCTGFELCLFSAELQTHPDTALRGFPVQSGNTYTHSTSSRKACLKEPQSNTQAGTAEAKTRWGHLITVSRRRGGPREMAQKGKASALFLCPLFGWEQHRRFLCLWRGVGFRFWLYGWWLQTDKKLDLNSFCLFSWKAWRYHLENPMAFSISFTNLWYLLRVMPVKPCLCSRKSWWKLNEHSPNWTASSGARRLGLASGEPWEKETPFPKQGVCSHHCHHSYGLLLSSFSFRKQNKTTW